MFNPQLLIPLAGVLSLLVLARRGCINPDVFKGCPPREAGLGVVDLWLGVVVLFAGMLITVEALTWLGWAGETGLQPAENVKRAILSQVLMQLPVAVFFIARATRQTGGLGQVGVTTRQPGRDLQAAGLALLAVLPIVMGLGVVIDRLSQLVDIPSPEYGHDLLRVLAQSRSTWIVVGLITSAVVIAPLLEELIFRGLLQTALLGIWGRSNRWSVVILSAAVFALIHANLPWQVLPSLFVLGDLPGLALRTDRQPLAQHPAPRRIQRGQLGVGDTDWAF